MKITYRLTPEEYGEAQRAHASSKALWRWRNRISLTIIIFFLAASIALSIFDSEMGVMVRPAIILFSGLLALLFLGRSNLVWRWQYNKIDALKRECTAEISDEGIISNTEVARSEMKWNLFTRWYEGKNVFLLYLQPRLFNIVPKRAFAPGEAEEFRELLRRKIPAKQ